MMFEWHRAHAELLVLQKKTVRRYGVWKILPNETRAAAESSALHGAVFVILASLDAEVRCIRVHQIPGVCPNLVFHLRDEVSGTIHAHARVTAQAHAQ